MISRAYPPRIGGTGSMIESICNGLAEEDFDVTVIAQHYGRAPSFEVKNKVRVFRTFNLSSSDEFGLFNLSLAGIGMTKRILQEKNHDIYHAHDISLAGFSTCLSKSFNGKKTFLLKYGGDLLFEFLSLKKHKGFNPEDGLEATLDYKSTSASVLRRIQNWYFNSYDYVLPNSQYAFDFLLKQGVSKKKTKLLPNAVDIHLFKQGNKKDARKKLRLPEDKKILLTASRLVKWKGVETALKALPLIIQKERNALLVVLGKGPEEENLKKMSKKMGVEKNVLFKGNVERENLALYFNAADIFLSPTFFEMMSNSILESMSSSCPVIASDIPSVREILGNNGVYFEKGNEQELTEKALSLLSNQSMVKELGNKSRTAIEKSFSVEKEIKNFVDLYKSVDNK